MMKTDTFAKDRKFIWSILISVLCLVVLFFFKDHLKYVIKTQHINISFDNRSTDTTLSKLKEFKADGWAGPKNISIGFDVKAIDDNYDNIFQTADDPATVRLELTQPQTLSLILGSGPSELKVHKITDDFGLNVWHKMEVHIDENKYVEVVLDGEKMLSFTDNNTTYQISRIVVGSGHNKTRNFQGEIKNFNISYELYKYAFLFECLFSLLYFLLCAPLMIVFHRIIVKYSNVSLLPGDQSMYHALFIPGLAAAIVFAAHTTDIFLRRTSYWLPFMLLGISSPFILFVYSKVLRMEITSNLARIAKIFTVISFILLVVFILSNSLPFFSDGSGILAILCLLTSVFCTLTFSGYLASSNDEKNLIFILALITFSLVPWVVMYDMPNWKQFISSLTARPILTTVIFFSITGIVHGYLFSTWKKFSYPTFSEAYPRFNKGMTIVLVASSLLLLLLMSFRSDTLFLGTSELHWEYFTGPIRNLKNGSWLLWDTPSQYGFLNILSASILPFKSSWESLYVFQGILLFVVSGILFKTYLSGSLLKRNIFFSILMTFSSLFFADPDLIGPYLYPSSSVMRFFWCYAILFFLYQANTRNGLSLNKIIFLGTPIWLMGFLWSAESAIYSSVTFLPAILIAILQRYQNKLNDSRKSVSLKHLFLYATIPFFLFATVICIISTYYWLRLGQLPDFYCFVEHGLSYAGGFGQINLNTSGPVWLLFILFSTILYTIGSMILRNPLNRNLITVAAAASCLWSIGSYFIGRAVANNVTAILPLLGFISVVVLNSSGSNESNTPNLILKVIMVPIFTIILMTSFGNMDFVNKLKKFQTLESNFSSKVRVAEPALQELLDQAKIKSTDPVVYYGFLAAMPQWKFGNQFVLSDRTWLPNPLQLAEEPITEARRNTYLQRFIETAKEEGGYLILTKGEAEDRAVKWLDIINKTHRPVNVFENDKWKIIYFKRR